MCTVMSWCSPQAEREKFEKGISRTSSRGPDDQRIADTGCGLMGFQRLSIMGLTPEGMQPFELNGSYAVCNGELYGFEAVREALRARGYTFASDSDCEIILPMYFEYGTRMFSMLDAEFAMIIFDGRSQKFIAARDPIGIRPLYYGFGPSGEYIFASEPKDLVGLTDRIMPFPPGCYFEDGQFIRYRDMASVTEVCHDGLESACEKIREKLVSAVRKRLVSDSKVGFLLSGGLDSSLVCAIAARECSHPIETFAIGMRHDPIDLKYAAQAAEYIGSHHTEVYMTPEDVLSSLERVIELLGTWDITTVRASIGMYLVCKAIHETTDIRVILTGEISDELFGYKYTDFAPSAQAFQEEAEKRIRELHMYDVLRADRCISVNSLEARVPFGDLDFASYVMSLDPEMKLNRYGKGKYLLRHAFEGTGILPDSILWREKAAFSDAVGHSMVDYLKEHAEERYTDSEFEHRCLLYGHGRPFTKESLLYRDIFEKYYPGQGEMIADFWMPNRLWEGCDVDDPSARVLSNYGDSGQ
ncbi:MAG: asparagine synthase B [Eubacteriaceae bacterium]|nr:asparagine synthase B [Eubacteriaceae bacterium]